MTPRPCRTLHRYHQQQQHLHRRTLASSPQHDMKFLLSTTSMFWRASARKLSGMRPTRKLLLTSSVILGDLRAVSKRAPRTRPHEFVQSPTTLYALPSTCHSPGCPAAI